MRGKGEKLNTFIVRGAVVNVRFILFYFLKKQRKRVVVKLEKIMWCRKKLL